METKDLKMHILQNKHSKLNEKESELLLKKFNLSKTQLPKILSNDPALPENCEIGDIIKIERKRLYQEQLKEWEQSIQQWEANGKQDKKPVKASKGKAKAKAEIPSEKELVLATTISPSSTSF